MTNSIKTGFALTFMSFWINAASLAQEPSSKLSILPRVEFGLMDYNFSFDDVVLANGSAGDGLEFEDDIYIGGLGLSAAYGRWGVDVVGRITTEGEAESQRFITDIVGNTPVAATHDSRSTFDRSELDVQIGYLLQKSKESSITIFLGYRYSKTEFDDRTTTVGEIVNAGAISPFDEVFDGNFNIDLEYFGPYLGAAFSIKVPNKFGIITVSPVLAFFDGEFVQKFEPDPGTRVPTIRDASVDGTSLGFNASLDWTIEVFNDLYFSIGIERSQLEFDAKSNSVQGDFEESYNRVLTKLRYSF